MIKVPLLECKRGAIAAKNGSYVSLISLRFVRKPHNMLCISTLSLSAQNSRISHQKILLCAQLAVLSVRNANIVSDGKASELGVLA